MKSLLLFMFGMVQGLWVKQMESKIFQKKKRSTQSEDKGFLEGDIEVDSSTNAYGSMKGGRWPKGIVPYYFESSISSYVQKRIMSAIGEYHKHTCLKFIPYNKHWSYISFYKGDGCHSPVGKNTLRKNRISIGSGCSSVGTIMHEIGHSIGLYHEQSRPDRDQYVKIIWENIPKDVQNNFKRHSSFWIDSLGTKYDYLSLMHYDAKAFGQWTTTIKTVDPAFQNKIGKNHRFSPTDIKQINLMYKDECSKQ